MEGGMMHKSIEEQHTVPPQEQLDSIIFPCICVS